MRKKKYLKPPQFVESFKKVLKFVLLRMRRNKYPKNLTHYCCYPLLNIIHVIILNLFIFLYVFELSSLIFLLI